jgi:DnaK suppressor protein
MDDNRARQLLSEERIRVQDLLDALGRNQLNDRDGANELGDMSDSSESLVSEGTDDAIAVNLSLRLEALDRADARLDDGTYGVSVKSGDTIPDERLEADPAAELTVDEAQELS